MSAVAGDRRAGFSQVTLVTGSGSSWSQATLAKRPSWTDGERAKISSRSPSPAVVVVAAARGGAPAAASPFTTSLAAPPFAATMTGAAVAPGAAPAGSTPSWSALRHAASKSPPSAPCQVSRTRSKPERSSPPAIRPTSSAALRPANSGAMSGCTKETVPSAARASPQASSQPASGSAQLARRVVSSAPWARTTTSGTCSSASAKPRSAGAV